MTDRSRYNVTPGRPRTIEDLARQRALSDGLAFPISHETGQLLAILTKAIGATRVLEIGLGYGVSTIYLASAIGALGRVDSIEQEENHITVAEYFLRTANLLPRVSIIKGKCEEILPRIHSNYDLVFLDADLDIYEHCHNDIVRITKRGGVLVAENIWDEVFALQIEGDRTIQTIQQYKQMVADDKRLISTRLEDAIIAFKEHS